MGAHEGWIFYLSPQGRDLDVLLVYNFFFSILKQFRIVFWDSSINGEGIRLC